MLRKSHPILDQLQSDQDRLDRNFGAPARIIVDNSPALIGAAVLEAAIANAIDVRYAIPRDNENPEST